MPYSRTSHAVRVIFIHIAIFILAILLFTDTCLADNSAQKYFIISSGTSGGNYNKAGHVLAELLNRPDDKRYAFKVISSNGSIENIKRLKNRFSDFAIVQLDVFVKNYYGDGDKIKNVSIISPLFQEKFFIYTHERSPISFEKFKAIINSSPSAIKIGLTSLDGASYKTFSEIASLLGLNQDNVEFVIGDYKKLSRSFISNKIDCVLTFSLPIKEVKKAQMVYFDDADIALLTGRMRHLTTAAIDSEGHKTLGVWALFVGLNSSINQIGEEVMIRRILRSSGSDGSIANQLSNTFNDFKSNDAVYDEYLKGLPVVAIFQSAIGHDDSSVKVKLGIFFGVLAILIAVLFPLFRNSDKNRWKYLWVRYKHILIGLLLVFGIYLLCVEWMILSEGVFFQEKAIKSSVLDITRTDLHLWNLVRIFANNDAGMFPISVTGKLAATLSMYVIWIGSISIAVVEFIMHKLIAKRRDGLMSVKFEDHIVIAGWNENTPKLIEGLLYACTEYHHKALKIVCVVADPKSVLSEYKFISDLDHRKELVLVKGYIRNRNVLEQCNARKAKIIILLAEEAGVHADEKTLMRALGIRKFCCENIEGPDNSSQGMDSVNDVASDEISLFKTKASVNPVYIIAEVNTEEFVPDLRDAGVNGVINKNKIADGLLVQSILNPGVSTLVNNVLTFSGDTNEFYTVDLLDKNNIHLRNRTFDELLLPLRRHNILLVAIKVVYRDQAGNEIVDEGELSRLLKSEGLYRQIITNPITDVETNRKTDADDQLITLAVSADKLNAGLKAVTFDCL